MKKILSVLAVALVLYVAGMALFAPAVLEAQSSYLWSLNVKNVLRLGDDKIVGDNAFTTTALVDTVVIAGTLTTDLFFISLEDTNAAGIGATSPVVAAVAGTDTLFVTRGFGGKSAAGYQWLRIRPY